MDINPLAFLGLALASLAVPHAWTFEEDKAAAILQKVLGQQRKVDYLRIESRSTESSASWNVKVQTSVSKGIMVTILAPSYRQGVITVDDTKVMKTYLPDRNALVVQSSPYQLQPSFESRWKLIRKNYTFQSGREETIAGQAVRELVIKPINDDVPTRRMYVDAKHSVVLRYTVDSGERRQVVVFDTKYVEFGSAAANSGFGLPAAASSAQQIVYTGPTKIVKPVDSKLEAGFSARMPQKLPFGFKISGAYLFRPMDGSGPYVQVKLTDGMVTLTVFQWLEGRSDKPKDAKWIQEDTFNVRYGIAVIPGDWMPENVLEQLVEAFLEKSE